MNFRQLLAGPLVLAIFSSLAGRACGDALAKLKPDKLEAVHKAILALGSQRRALSRPGPYRDYRANLHVHSLLSHDSRGKIEEIVAAAKATGTRVLMFTEHPSERYDYFKEGHRGMNDGVLLIPGAETKGFLVYPTQSMHGLDAGSPQEFSDLVRSRGGLTFLSHLEERMNWEIRGLTGTEIYNTHADFKDEKNLIAAMRNPLWMITSANLFRKYPQESFSALLDYPRDYLNRWDELCEKAPHTGVAANDSHQNVGLTIRLVDQDKVRFEDALGEKLLELRVAANTALQQLAKGKSAGDVLFQIRLDHYENSLRHVGTHLLLAELIEKAVWEALEAGRAFVAFDWLADSTGFDFAATSGTHRYEMGSRLVFEPGLKLHAQAPLPVEWKLIRNGKGIREASGATFDFAVAEPGNYRIEAWLNVAGDATIWILSNPVYLRRAPER
jgi:hypothetical protein